MDVADVSVVYVSADVIDVVVVDVVAGTKIHQQKVMERIANVKCIASFKAIKDQSRKIRFKCNFFCLYVRRLLRKRK